MASRWLPVAVSIVDRGNVSPTGTSWPWCLCVYNWAVRRGHFAYLSQDVVNRCHCLFDQPRTLFLNVQQSQGGPLPAKFWIYCRFSGTARSFSMKAFALLSPPSRLPGAISAKLTCCGASGRLAVNLLHIVYCIIVRTSCSSSVCLSPFWIFPWYNPLMFLLCVWFPCAPQCTSPLLPGVLGASWAPLVGAQSCLWNCSILFLVRLAILRVEYFFRFFKLLELDVHSICLLLLFFCVDAEASFITLQLMLQCFFFLLSNSFLDCLPRSFCRTLCFPPSPFHCISTEDVWSCWDSRKYFAFVCAFSFSGPSATPSIDAVCSQTSPGTIWFPASSSLSCDACYIFASFLSLPCCGVRMTMCLSRCLAAAGNKMRLRTTEVQNRRYVVCTNQHLSLVLACTLCSTIHPNVLSSYVFASFIVNRRSLACVLEHVD